MKEYEKIKERQNSGGEIRIGARGSKRTHLRFASTAWITHPFAATLDPSEGLLHTIFYSIRTPFHCTNVTGVSRAAFHVILDTAPLPLLAWEPFSFFGCAFVKDVYSLYKRLLCAANLRVRFVPKIPRRVPVCESHSKIELIVRLLHTRA